MLNTISRPKRPCRRNLPDTVHSGSARVVPSTLSCLTAKLPTGRDFSAPQSRLFMFSAASETALQELVASTYEYFTAADFRHLPRHDVVSAGHRGFVHQRERLSVVGRNSDDIRQKLGEYLSNGQCDAVRRSTVSNTRQSVVFVFCGQGSQWWNMGRELLASEPMFRETIAACDRLFREQGAEWSLIDELTRDEADSRLDQTAIAQPAIFALQSGLVELWKSWGGDPAARVGHGSGDVASAYAAGRLSLEEAARVAFQRGRCMDLDQSDGQLLAAALSETEARELIAAGDHPVELASINSPTCVTFAGRRDALKSLARELRAAKRWRRLLEIPHAFHSAAMEPLRERLLEALGTVSQRHPAIPMLSTVTGRPLEGEALDADYWWQNIRRPVQFAAACELALRDGHQVFLEIGPHPILAGCITQCADESDHVVNLFASLRRDDHDGNVMLRSAGELFALGANVRRSAACRSDLRQPVAADANGAPSIIKVRSVNPSRLRPMRMSGGSARRASCIQSRWRENGQNPTPH